MTEDIVSEEKQGAGRPGNLPSTSDVWRSRRQDSEQYATVSRRRVWFRYEHRASEFLGNS